MSLENKARLRRKRSWIRLDCNGVLHGSMNAFLTLEEQAIFIKLIVMAEMYGETPGLISDNDGCPLPHTFIAHELHSSLSSLESTLKKCTERKSIQENSNGITLVNFNKYQFTEYDRQLPYRQAKQEESKGKKLHAEEGHEGLFCSECGFAIEKCKLTAKVKICPLCKKQGKESPLIERYFSNLPESKMR